MQDVTVGSESLHVELLHIFQRKFNETLAAFPELPLTFSAEEDQEWEEYRSMLAIAQASDSDEEADEDTL